MAITCPNGHLNDEGNRFCDQCGAPLQAPASATPTATAAPVATGDAAQSITCPVCGQENVPGTAFCDNCGAALPPPQPAAAQDAAVASSGAPSTVGDGAGTGTVTCPQCGATNDATNRFCDTCGATLHDSGSTPDASMTMKTPMSQSTDQQAAATTGAPLMEAEGNAPATSTPDSATATASTPLPTEGAVPPVVTAADQAAPSWQSGSSQPAPAPAQSAGTMGADRQRLEDEIAQQQKVVSQLEQTQAALGPATPAAIVQALDEARAKLNQAQADLDALAAQPQVDPAEVARLEDEIAQQQKVVSQLEQTQAALGPATPAAIVQALDEARAKLNQAQAALQALPGGASQAAADRPLPSALDVATQRADELAQQPPTPAAAASSDGSSGGSRTYEAAGGPAQPSAPAQPGSAPVAANAPAVVTSAPSTPAPVRGTDQLPPAPAPQQASGPRLVLRDGTNLSLPRTGQEIVVGREDPVSGIHPDIDLTSYGGEAGGVSRRHAVLREQNGQWSVMDLDSTNYTRVDGNRLAPNTPTPLQDGARVQFGRVELEFRAG